MSYKAWSFVGTTKLATRWHYKHIRHQANMMMSGIGFFIINYSIVLHAAQMTVGQHIMLKDSAALQLLYIYVALPLI